ncbi:MAG: hydrogenase subunit MbhD domain-containing protein [Candidatus Micrarchaeota archaeon]
MIELIAGITGLIILASSLYAIWTKDMLASAIALGVSGLAATAYFLVLHAPDVAMAEAAVGAGIVPLILIVTISKTERNEK